MLWGYLISAEGDLNAVIADSNAQIGELSTEIEELAGKISSAEADLSKATGIRGEENDSFSSRARAAVHCSAAMGGG